MSEIKEATIDAQPPPRVRAPWRQLRDDMRRVGMALFVITLALIAAKVGDPKLTVILGLLPMLISLYLYARALKRWKYRIRSRMVGPTRLLVVVFPILAYAQLESRSVLSWIVILLTGLLLIAEPVLGKVASGRRVRVCQLPGVPDSRPLRVQLRTVRVIDTVVLLTTLVVIGLRLPIVLAVAALLMAGALVLVVLIDSWMRVKESLEADQNLQQAIENYGPKFILYYGVPTGTEYQVAMWMKYLERIGEPFIVVLRDLSTFETIAAMTEAPVIVRTSMRQLDTVVVPSVTAAFYVNNGAKNAHLVRYPQLTHIQLLHGDSDKATSFNPITAMFDKVFVAGQAGIDRYVDHDIDIPLHKFEIVGRPQVEDIRIVAGGARSVQTVLYAPTWQGHFSDTNYCSLPVALPIIEGLLKRGKRVIFRPHPYSYKHPESKEVILAIHAMLSQDKERTGTDHIWGADAEQELTVFDCFNESDAMVSEVSSVVADYLYSEKPMLLVAMASTIGEFTAEYPLARAAYVTDADLTGLDASLDEMLEADTKALARKELKVYYLGDFPAETYAEGFIEASRRIIQRAEAIGR